MSSNRAAASRSARRRRSCREPVERTSSHSVGEEVNMARRILAAALVISLTQINLAHAQTAGVVSPGKIQESVGREIKKQMLVNFAAPAPQSARQATSPDDTAAAASQLTGPFIRTRGSFKQHVFATIGAVA